MLFRSYLKNTFGIEKPRIGLLNIGTEENKGNELTKETSLCNIEFSDEFGRVLLSEIHLHVHSGVLECESIFHVT